MATLNMDGPFPYTREEIDRLVPEGVPGNYAFGSFDVGKNVFYVQYVGRSDSNLHDRIGHMLGKYSHFMASIANSAMEAYHKECQNWHDFGGEEKCLDNEIHPDRPNGAKLAFCPVCTKRIINKICK